MTISINNYLSSICLHLGLIGDKENKIKILLDTRVVMNSGNLSCYFGAMLKFPKMVDEFIQFGAYTGYDVVQLMTALDIEYIQ